MLRVAKSTEQLVTESIKLTLKQTSREKPHAFDAGHICGPFMGPCNRSEKMQV